MPKKIFLALIFLISSLLICSLVCRAGFRLKWVEVDVILDKDGKAQISYTIRWSCRNANLQ
jgi:hypothetical protein